MYRFPAEHKLLIPELQPIYIIQVTARSEVWLTRRLPMLFFKIILVDRLNRGVID